MATNARSMLNEYCQARGLKTPNYEAEQRMPSKLFHARVTEPILTQYCGEGAQTKAAAREMAAAMALRQLQARSDASGIASPTGGQQAGSESLVVGQEHVVLHAADYAGPSPRTRLTTVGTSAAAGRHPNDGLLGQRRYGAGATTEYASTAGPSSTGAAENRRQPAEARLRREWDSSTPALRTLAELRGVGLSKLVLVDYDNCQGTDILLNQTGLDPPRDVLVFLVFGPAIPAPPQVSYDNVEQIQSFKSVKNAADLGIAYLAGKFDILMPPGIEFVLVSGDKCFDELEEILRHDGRSVQLINATENPDAFLAAVYGTTSSETQLALMSAVVAAVEERTAEHGVPTEPAKFLRFVRNCERAKFWKDVSFTPLDVLRRVAPDVAAEIHAGGRSSPRAITNTTAGVALATDYVQAQPPTLGAGLDEVQLRTLNQIIARVQTAASEGNFPRTPDKARAFIRNSARSKLWDRANFGEGDVLQHLIDRGHVAMTQHRDQTRLEWQA